MIMFIRQCGKKNIGVLWEKRLNIFKKERKKEFLFLREAAEMLEDIITLRRMFQLENLNILLKK